MVSPEALAAVTGGQAPAKGESLAPGELELATRLILGDDEVTVLPGDGWAYLGDESLITYPEHLVSTWSDDRLIGGMCHVLPAGGDKVRSSAGCAASAATAGPQIQCGCWSAPSMTCA